MAKRKHKRRRMKLGTKLAMLFVLVFIISVAVMAHVSVRRVQRVYDEAEAQRQALMDTSWIDADASVSWIAHQNISEKDDEGNYWTTVESNLLLRTHCFADGTTKDISLNDMYGYGAQIVPADDPRGFVLADWNGEAWSFYRINENDDVVPLFYEARPNVGKILAYYDGNIYCNVESDISKAYSEFWSYTEYEHFLAQWNASLKEMTRYRGEGLCVDANGRAAVLESRSTGIMEITGGYTDENGDWVDDYSEMESWTLGIEDAQGGWTAIAPVGEDSALKKVSSAAWLDGDHLLIAARTSAKDAEAKEYHLFSYTLSTKELAPWMDASSEQLRLGMDTYIWENSLSVSPDGRYISYNAAKTGFKEDSALLMIQSLENGRYAQLSPQDPIVEGEQKISTGVANDNNISFWKQ